MTALDHIVVAALSLDEGVGWVDGRLHTPLEPGGQHLGFGTHNALLRLGSEVNLEVLAPDPAQAHPARPRLFGLDDPATRAALAGGPRVLHWVVRATDAERAAAELAMAAGLAPGAIGVPTTMRRGDLTWVLTIPPDGSRPPMGLPSVIDWGATPHPCSRLPDRGARLERLEIGAPPPALAALRMLVEEARVLLKDSPAETLSARLATPRGTVVL